jgi:hypothetical protein
MNPTRRKKVLAKPWNRKKITKKASVPIVGTLHQRFNTQPTETKAQNA